MKLGSRPTVSKCPVLVAGGQAESGNPGMIWITEAPNPRKPLQWPPPTQPRSGKPGRGSFALQGSDNFEASSLVLVGREEDLSLSVPVFANHPQPIEHGLGLRCVVPLLGHPVYIRVDPRGRVAVPVADAAGAPTGTFSATGSEDTWEGRLRIQRDF